MGAPREGGKLLFPFENKHVRTAQTLFVVRGAKGWLTVTAMVCPSQKVKMRYNFTLPFFSLRTSDIRRRCGISQKPLMSLFYVDFKIRAVSKYDPPTGVLDT